jgi:phage FluMu protein gp41
LYSSVIPFLPQLKAHHIVLISTQQKNNAYTIDFSPLPIDSSFMQAQLYLLFAGNVQGEIRVRHIENAYSKDDKEIISEWEKVNDLYSNGNGDISQKLSNQVIASIKDADVITLLDKIKKWNTTMNLYTHNCQHFSKFVNDIIID